MYDDDDDGDLEFRIWKSEMRGDQETADDYREILRERRYADDVTEAQERMLARLGYNGDRPKHKWAASKLIDKLMRDGAKPTVKTDEPPTAKQLGFLNRLGYQGEQPKTMTDASALIEKTLAAKKAERKAAR